MFSAIYASAASRKIFELEDGAKMPIFNGLGTGEMEMEDNGAK